MPDPSPNKASVDRASEDTDPPKGFKFHVEDRGDSLTITINAASNLPLGGGYLYWVMSIGIFGTIFASFFASFFARSAIVSSTLLQVLIAGILLYWFHVITKKRRATIRLDDRTISVRHAALPWPTTTIHTEDVMQVHCDTTYHRPYNSAETSIPEWYSYGLKILTKSSHKSRLLLCFSDQEDAHFVERRESGDPTQPPLHLRRSAVVTDYGVRIPAQTSSLNKNRRREHFSQ